MNHQRRVGVLAAALLIFPLSAQATGPFTPRWQLGDFFADTGEFNANYNNAEYTYTVGTPGTPLPIPGS